MRMEKELEKSFNGKKVFTQETFDYSVAKIGDYVEEAVVDDAMNVLPPACMKAECSQMGSPYGHKDDPETGEWRATFTTFKRVSNDIWEYCGHCFLGENKER